MIVPSAHLQVQNAHRVFYPAPECCPMQKPQPANAALRTGSATEHPDVAWPDA